MSTCTSLRSASRSGANRYVSTRLRFRMMLGRIAILAVVFASVGTLASADTSSDVYLYVFRGSPNANQGCDFRKFSDLQLVTSLSDLIHTNLVLNGASPQVHVVYPNPNGVTAAPPDAVVDAEMHKYNNVLVADLCANGEVVTASIASYAISYTAGQPPSVVAGTPISGTFDALEGANWGPLFYGTAHVGFLPVLGDNSDIINGNLQRNLPYLQTITTIDSLDNLCSQTQDKIVVSGQGSLATQNLDTFRTLVVGGAFSFSQPAPWGWIWKIFGGGVGLVGIPNTQVIPAQIVDCHDASHIVAFGPKIAFADPKDAQYLIVGHASQSAVGTNNKVQRRVLDNAIADLQNQIDCIVQRTKSANFGTKYDADPVASSTWCDDYYKNLPKTAVDAAYYRRPHAPNATFQHAPAAATPAPKPPRPR